jgi:hypothetical protein
MSLEDCHRLGCHRVSPWNRASSRRELILSSRLQAVLDVDILQLVHSVGGHGEFSPSLVSNELLILSLSSRYERLCRDSKSLEGLRTSHLPIEFVRLTKSSKGALLMWSITCVLIIATSVLETVIAPIRYLLMIILADGVISDANASDIHPPLRKLRIIQLVSPHVLLVCPHSDFLLTLRRLVSC